MRKCDRCGKETQVVIMSRFNTDELCDECEGKEKQHPDYRTACDAEEEAVRGGHLNFAGIGKPSDL